MRKDTAIGVGRNLVGKGEAKPAKVLGNTELDWRGFTDEVSGAVQNGISRLIDRAIELVEDTPDLLAGAVKQGRDATKRSNAAMREQLGDNGVKYLVAGAFALLALGTFAARRK